MSRKRSRLDQPLARSQTGVSSCKRCRSRKIKCDDGFPRCDGCEKADVLCFVVDPSTTQDHTRAQVQSLQDELAQLEALLTSATHPESGTHSAVSNERVQHGQNTAGTTETEHDGPLASSAVNMNQRQQFSFREFHVCHPILDRDEMDMMLRAVYNDVGDVCMPEQPFSPAQKHNLFQLNMALAIGSIKLFHESPEIPHPFGFFTAALEINPPSEFNFNEVSDVGNLLLIAHFGLFYSIGCSIWELGCLCVRICIELQFHRQRSAPICAAVPTQRRQQIFWESYLLDRFSSSILGRPFAVEDEAIDVDVSSDSFGKVHNHILRIGRITSQIHISIYSPTPQDPNLHTSLNLRRTSDLAACRGSTDALLHLRKFHSYLRTWKSEAPTYDSPTCVYETAEFFEMTFQESRVWLFKAVIHKLPESRQEMRRRLSMLCHQAAQRILACFNNIKGPNLLSYNRTLPRLILISGLTIVSTIKTQYSRAPIQTNAPPHSTIDTDFWLEDIASDSATCPSDPATFSAALETCEQNLSRLASLMPEMSAYAVLFGRLRTEADEAILKPRSDQERGAMHQASSNARPAVPVAAAELGRHNQNGWSGGFMQWSDTLQELQSSASAQFASTGVIPEYTMLHQTLEADTTRNIGCDVVAGDSLWTLSNEPWMEGIDGDISGLIWDTAIPWQWSPLTNM